MRHKVLKDSFALLVYEVKMKSEMELERQNVQTDGLASDAEHVRNAIILGS